MHSKALSLVFTMVVIGLSLAPHGAHANTVSTVEETVRDYFEDIPVMIDIARCESKFRQFNADGTVLRGGWAGGMIGVFQFYESIHRSTAFALGFDLSTLEGNLGYARHLYSESGTTPWNSAKSCWKISSESSVSSTGEETKIDELKKKIATLKVLVAQLQALLEKKRKA